MNIHKNARLTFARRLEMVQDILEHKLTHAAAAKHHVSVPTVPSGTFLYAANQNTDTIAVFRIQPSTGKLKFSTLVNTPTPVDVEFGALA